MIAGDTRSTGTTLARLGSGILLSLVVAGVVAGCGLSFSGHKDPVHGTGDGRLVWISGRDDHGLTSLPMVPLYREETFKTKAGFVADGTIARVVARDGMALKVQLVEGGDLTGWIDDFYLRGEVRLVGPPPTCASFIGTTGVPGGTLVTLWQEADKEVLVETVSGKKLRGTTPRTQIQELPPQGKDCSDVPPGTPHYHGPFRVN